jgi:hypothetical protein
METKAINRVAAFLNLVCAQIEISYEVAPGISVVPAQGAELPANTPVMQFMGSGLSDMLMYGDIVAFLQEVAALNERQEGA